MQPSTLAMDDQLTQSPRRTAMPLCWSVNTICDFTFSNKDYQMFYVSQIFYKATINCSKLAVICMYLRIFHATPQRWFIYTCWILVGVVVCYTTASMIVTIFQCDPIPYFWNKTQYHGHCIDDTPFWYTNSIYNILTDLVIVTSVPWVVWTLHLPRKQKLLLCSVFGLVILYLPPFLSPLRCLRYHATNHANFSSTFFASIMRLTTLTPASKSKDPVYGTLVTSMWSTTEASCAVITTNLPMLRHTIKALWPRFIGTNNPNSGTNEYTGDGNSQLPPHFHICANCRPGPTGIPTASQIYSSQPQPSSRPQRPDEEIEMQITTLPRQTSGQAPRGTGTSPPLSPTQSRGSFRRDSLLPSPVPFALAGSSSSYAQRYSDMPSPVPFALAGPSSSYAQRYSDMPSPLPLARGSASSSLTPRRNDFRSPSPFPALMTGTLPPRSPSHSTNVVVPAPLTPTRRDRDTTKTPSPLLARFKGRNGGASAENVDGEEGTHILGEEMSHQISNHSGDGDGEV